MRIKYTLFTLILVSFFSGIAQDKASRGKVKKAQKAYYIGDYSLAVSRFKEVLEIENNNYSANYELGRIYLKHFNYYDSASLYLGKAIENPTKDTIFESYLDYGSALQLKGDYKTAIENYEFFKSDGLKDNSFAELLSITIDRKIKECNYAISETKEAQKKHYFSKEYGS